MKFPGLRQTLAALVASLMLTMPTVSQAKSLADQDPSALRMTGDALIARPMLFGATVLGGAIFVISLPFHALGGNTAQAADTLFIEPAKNTFFRCLGCVERVNDQHLNF